MTNWQKIKDQGYVKFIGKVRFEKANKKKLTTFAILKHHIYYGVDIDN